MRTAERSRPHEERSLNTVDTTESLRVAELAARAASDRKASDIRILDMGELLGITDYFVIASASNDRLLKSVVEEVEHRVKTELAMSPRRREGQGDTGWMLLDYGMVVVHVFTDEQRAFYDLERLWSDAPTTAVEDTSPGVPVAASNPEA